MILDINLKGQFIVIPIEGMKYLSDEQKRHLAKLMSIIDRGMKAEGKPSTRKYYIIPAEDNND